MPNCPARINELADLNSQVMAEITAAHRLQSLIQSLSTLRLKTCDVTVHVSSGFINRKTMILYSEAHFLTKHSLSSYKYAWKQITGHKLGNETRSSGVLCSLMRGKSLCPVLAQELQFPQHVICRLY